MTPQPRPVYAVGTGRCGTHFLTALFQAAPGVRACHESDPMNEAFHRYCQWNRLAVDDGGFLEIKRDEIDAARREGKIFFEASGYLSLSIAALHQAFRPRFILIVRNPIDTVNSLWAKGWYETVYRKRDGRAPVGYHAVGRPHHFFSRLVPNGAEFADWQALCRVGKLGWYWSMINRAILARFEDLPVDSRMIVRLEDLDHDGYRRVADFAGVPATLSAAQFDAIAEARPGALPGHRALRSWSATELAAFAGQAADVAGILGYEVDFVARWEAAQHEHRAAEVLA
jgi:hypothetical protein